MGLSPVDSMTLLDSAVPLKFGWESSGVHIEYQGDRQDLGHILSTCGQSPEVVADGWVCGLDYVQTSPDYV